jgi:hypothetical protein
VKQRYYACAAVVVFFGLVALLVIKASAAHARTQAVLKVMSDMGQAQRDCLQPESIETNRPAPAHSSPEKFNIHLFTQKLIALDRSKCPADFQAAYEEWLKAVEAAETYSTSNKAVDVLALFHANGNAQSLAIIDQLKQTQWNLRKAAQRYGVTVTGQ